MGSQASRGPLASPLRVAPYGKWSAHVFKTVSAEVHYIECPPYAVAFVTGTGSPAATTLGTIGGEAQHMLSAELTTLLVELGIEEAFVDTDEMRTSSWDHSPAARRLTGTPRLRGGARSTERSLP